MSSWLTGLWERIRGLGRRNDISLIVAFGFFLLLAIYLFPYSQPIKTFSDELLIYDTIWLNAWSVAFILVTAIIWLSNLGWRAKAMLGVMTLGIYGFIELGLIFDGTPFSTYGYWGDQKFRQAMILKFMTLGYPTDFYYKDLPPFYPPLLYLVLAAIGKIFSLPAYQMLKVGGQLVVLLCPWLLFGLWRPLVGSMRAWLVVLFTFLVCASPTPYVLSAPHAFVAVMIFIPWWLRYVENVRGLTSAPRHWLTGGLLGAVILSTYFYPVMVGLFLIAVRFLVGRLWKLFGPPPGFKWSRALGVLLMSAVLSAWYWLPAVWSVAQAGFDRSRGEWHHIDSASIGLLFTNITWSGLLFLGGIAFSLRRRTSLIHRSLLVLIAIIVPYLLFGSILGALDRPINLVKAREMLIVFAGPFIGLAAAALWRRGNRPRTKWLVPGLAVAALLVLCNQFNTFAKTDVVKTARTAYVPSWNTDSAEMQRRAGSVFLCGEETFPSFYPVYTFLAANEHYSNPACRFKRRYDLLELLEKVDDPRIVNLVLRTNKYDKVEYFMPYRGDTGYEITISLSNYPNQYYTRVFKYPIAMFADTALYRRQRGDNLYEVTTPTASEGFKYVRRWSGDTLVNLMQMALIRDHLRPDGQAEFDRYLEADWSNWRRPPEAEKAPVFGDTFQLKDLRLVAEGDSLHLLMAFEALKVLPRQLKVMVHLFIDDQMTNYDFSPENPTSNWPRYETIICRHTIPRPDRPFRLFIGLYDRLGNLPGTLRVDSRPGS